MLYQYVTFNTEQGLSTFKKNYTFLMQALQICSLFCFLLFFFVVVVLLLFFVVVFLFFVVVCFVCFFFFLFVCLFFLFLFLFVFVFFSCTVPIYQEMKTLKVLKV